MDIWLHFENSYIEYFKYFMMANRKKRVEQHIMEDMSYKLIRKLLPNHWVVRDFNKPDYGIDLIIELYDKTQDHFYENLGEYVFVQVKSSYDLKIKNKKVHPVKNVSKELWKEDKSDYFDIDVVKFVLETDLLYTVQKFGSSISMLLFLADLTTEKVYFICLNDYIDKIILPKSPSFANQKNITIEIPIMNEFHNSEMMLKALKVYGKRAKLLAAFSKFYYQKNEILHLLNIKDYPIITCRDTFSTNSLTEKEFVGQILFFLNQIIALDIWDVKEWTPLVFAKKEIDKLFKELQETIIDLPIIKERIILLWHNLSNLSVMYEELCREWFLPKYISILTSYPEGIPVTNQSKLIID